MAVTLTTGVIADIHAGNQPESFTLQVLAARKFPTGDRSRLLVSDGVHSSGFAILASQLSHLVTSGEVGVNTVIKVNRYFCNDVQSNKKMMIILEMNIVMSGDDVGEVIGNPQSFDKLLQSGAAPTSTAAPSPPKSTRPATSPAPASNAQRNIPNQGGSDNTSQAPQGMPNVRKIDSLTPYQNKWTICARVTQKGNIRTWSKSTGDGKLFSMNLLDDSGEIRATAFNAECDRFYDLIEPNKVYYFSGASLKTANKQFSNVDNEYEMTFNSNTQVVPCAEESSIPSMQFNFVSFDQLESVGKDSLIDFIAVCKEANEINTVTQRSTGRELKKRDLILVDETNKSVNLTMWGADAEKFDGSSNPVIAVKGARVSDFGGVSLSLLQSSAYQINPDIKEAYQLKGWWEQTGCSSNFSSLSGTRGANQGSVGSMVLKTFQEIKNEGLGSGEKPDYYSAKANVVFIRKENLLYMACPAESCNKKVTDMSNGMYRCEKCNKEFDRFKWRLMLSVNLGDFTSSQWVTLFQDTAEVLLGCTAEELATMREDNPDMFQEYLVNKCFNEFIFRCRIKMETYNDESRLKTTVMSVHPMNYVEYNRRLIKEIKEMSA